MFIFLQTRTLVVLTFLNSLSLTAINVETAWPRHTFTKSLQALNNFLSK